ncbi:MAG: peptide chain release factor N(5)-glutamine methyltransferase [Anaerolineae bacterium]|jgi:release factor glutamine methyltransferase|nr:Release factor glutamine methyltransferase [Anaerolineales bacterium]MCE7918265.1 peptide chain release factor N(5)-glutamine methyltransferase [Chloroflexi bacterium CFX1]MCQ3946507.1 peptide chain release factor N(5)-glutamine methyltransferase [Anaerolineae bacterium]OQY86295.1 MAG: protein-(glutamine-N5) methyltransferase, release factor-specific [Anaerolineae bacterium UTCFX3]MCZ2287478.1 peptide chain release factor N(5)-glutamine methyltransferase [Anaerolineales bacterium]
MDVASLLEEISGQLRAVTDTPDLDAQVLLAHLMGKPRTWLAAHPEARLSALELDSARREAARLAAGAPLPHILGRWEFFGLDFEVTPDVLIPRPETELLAEQAILWLQSRPVTNLSSLRAADVGTGSGCIAVALAKHVPDARVLATDLSLPALQVARRNAHKHGVAARVDFVQCDLLPPRPSPLPTESHFDVICANLPYIPTSALSGLSVFDHEPALALDGGSDGLDPIRRLLKIAPEWLAPDGLILLEIESRQGMAAVSLAYDSFEKATINLRRDLAGRERLLAIRL